MRSLLLRQFDRLARRAMRNEFGDLRGRDGFNVLEIAKLKAAFESALYYERHLVDAKTMHTDLALLSHAVALSAPDGLRLEFGVASGRTISHLARELKDREIFGFDSFEGLPESWRSGFEKGRFAQKSPTVPPNVHLIKGLFDQSLPPFLAVHREPVALLHVDCDLYASTRTVLFLLADRIIPGTVIVFDEYWNYPGWRHHEHLALREFAEARNMNYRYEAFVPSHQQVCIVVQ